jgi:hypothetical protein
MAMETLHWCEGNEIRPSQWTKLVSYAPERTFSSLLSRTKYHKKYHKRSPHFTKISHHKHQTCHQNTHNPPPNLLLGASHSGLAIYIKKYLKAK